MQGRSLLAIVLRRLPLISTVIAAVVAITLVVAIKPSVAPAQSGEVQLCHYTGDPDQLYVLVTASGAELESHNSHENDIIPAPPSGCPSNVPPVDPLPTPTSTPTPPAPSPSVVAPGTVTICHAIGGGLYQQVEASPSDVEFHLEHDDDIVPAPAAGCPSGRLPADSDDDDLIPDAVDDGGSRPASSGRGGALPSNATAALPMLTDTSRAVQGIPYTGARPDVLMLLGLSLLMAGAGVRLLLAD